MKYVYSLNMYIVIKYAYSCNMYIFIKYIHIHVICIYS